MKKALVLGAIVAIVATPAMFANVVYTVASEGNGGYGPYQTGQGGEFTLYTPTVPAAGQGVLSLSGYSSVAKNQDISDATPNFQTFCVEGSVYIYPWTTYDATLTGVTTLGDPLTQGVAWLYQQFATGGTFGGIATYNYGAGRSTTAGELQNAIWAFMGQESQTFAGNAGNPFLIAAVDHFGGGAGGLATADAAAPAGYDGVSILNLWNGDPRLNSPGQGQLYYAPDGGATLALLGIALSGLAIYRRRV